MNTVLSNITVSVTELKRDFASILKQADGSPIAYHNHKSTRGLSVACGPL